VEELVDMALRIYKRRLFSGQMRVLVTRRSPSERRAAWELGLAGDDVIREIQLDATFDKVLQQATTDHTNDTNGMLEFVQSVSFVVSSDCFRSAFGSLDA